ncbi:MAG: hypothetical protein HRF40_10420 [Nitrososphaera sp.]
MSKSDNNILAEIVNESLHTNPVHVPERTRSFFTFGRDSDKRNHQSKHIFEPRFNYQEHDEAAVTSRSVDSAHATFNCFPLIMFPSAQLSSVQRGKKPRYPVHCRSIGITTNRNCQ